MPTVFNCLVTGHISFAGEAVTGFTQNYNPEIVGTEDITLAGDTDDAGITYNVSEPTTDFFVRFSRSDTSTTGTADRVPNNGGVHILKLDPTNNYGRYTSTQPGVITITESDMVLDENLEQDVGITRTGNAVTLANTGRYLVHYEMDLHFPSTNDRTDATAFIAANGTPIDGTRSYAYMRGREGTSDSALSWTGIIDINAGDSVVVRHVKTDGIDSTIDAITTILQIWQIPSSGNEVIMEATTGDFNTNGIFTYDTLPYIDTASFTASAGTDNIIVDQQDHVLSFATMSRSTQTTPRAYPEVRFVLDGTTVDYMAGGVYERNSGGTALANSVIGILPSVNANGVIQVETAQGSGQTGAVTNDAAQLALLSLESVFGPYSFPALPTTDSNVGDFLILSNNGLTDSLGTNGVFDPAWDTVVTEQGSVGTYIDGKFRLRPGKYLIMYSEKFATLDTTNNQRFQIQGEIYQDGVGVIGGRGSDYIRKNNGQQSCIVSGSVIVDVATDSTDVIFDGTADTTNAKSFTYDPATNDIIFDGNASNDTGIDLGHIPDTTGTENIIFDGNVDDTGITLSYNAATNDIIFDGSAVVTFVNTFVYEPHPGDTNIVFDGNTDDTGITFNVDTITDDIIFGGTADVNISYTVDPITDDILFNGDANDTGVTFNYDVNPANTTEDILFDGTADVNASYIVDPITDDILFNGNSTNDTGITYNYDPVIIGTEDILFDGTADVNTSYTVDPITDDIIFNGDSANDTGRDFVYIPNIANSIDDIIFDGTSPIGNVQNYEPELNLGRTEDITFDGQAIIDIAEAYEWIPNTNDVNIDFDGSSSTSGFDQNYIANPTGTDEDIIFSGNAGNDVSVTHNYDPVTTGTEDIIFEGIAGDDVVVSIGYVSNPTGTDENIIFGGNVDDTEINIGYIPNPFDAEIDILFEGVGITVVDRNYIPNPAGTDEDIIFNGYNADDNGITFNYNPNATGTNENIIFDGNAGDDVNVDLGYVPNETGTDEDIIFSGDATQDVGIEFGYIPNPTNSDDDIIFDGTAPVTFVNTFIYEPHPGDTNIVFDGTTITGFDQNYIANPAGTDEDIIFDGNAGDDVEIRFDYVSANIDNIIFNGNTDDTGITFNFNNNPAGTDEDILFNGDSANDIELSFNYIPNTAGTDEDIIFSGDATQDVGIEFGYVSNTTDIIFDGNTNDTNITVNIDPITNDIIFDGNSGNDIEINLGYVPNEAGTDEDIIFNSNADDTSITFNFNNNPTGTDEDILFNGDAIVSVSASNEYVPHPGDIYIHFDGDTVTGFDQNYIANPASTNENIVFDGVADTPITINIESNPTDILFDGNAGDDVNVDLGYVPNEAGTDEDIIFNSNTDDTGITFNYIPNTDGTTTDILFDGSTSDLNFNFGWTPDPADINIIFDGVQTSGFTQNYNPNPTLGQTDIEFAGDTLVEAILTTSEIFSYTPNLNGTDVDIIFSGASIVRSSYLPNPLGTEENIIFDGDAIVSVCWNVNPTNNNNGDIIFDGNADINFDDTFEYIPNPTGTDVNIIFDGSADVNFDNTFEYTPNETGTDVDIIFDGDAIISANIAYIPEGGIVFGGAAGLDKQRAGGGILGGVKGKPITGRTSRHQPIVVFHEPSTYGKDAKVGFEGNADTEFVSASWSPLAHPDVNESKFSFLKDLKTAKKKNYYNLTESKKDPVKSLIHEYNAESNKDINLKGNAEFSYYDHRDFLIKEDDKIIGTLLKEQTRIFSYITYDKKSKVK